MALAPVACGGTPDRPEVRETGGRTEYIVSDGGGDSAEPCEHGSVVECKVWVTDVDCFTGLAVCDQGELSGCMDADGAEQKLAEISESVE
jgi:hypothetical protein